MAGLFDLAQLFGPNGAPQGFPTVEQLMGSDAALRAPPEVGEVNPNPVAPGMVPMPVPNPLQPPPSVIAAANNGAGAVPINQGPPEQDVGAALAAPDPTTLAARAPTIGAEGPVAPDATSTDISAQSKAPQRPSLAQALKGVTAPAAPVLQKLATPNAPRATGTIKSGELQALLMALNAGGGGGKPVRLGG